MARQYETWDEIEWTGERAKLTPPERAALYALVDANEPTWIVIRGELADPRAAEEVLRALESRGLVDSHVEQSGEPGHETDEVLWWGLTDQAWDLLGLTKPRRYW